MIERIAYAVGIILVAIGVLGFVPAVSPDGMLLGLFHVNGAHNVVHILTGVLAIIAASYGVASSRLFFQALGIIYGLVAVLGFIYGDAPILGILANNVPNNWLHVVISLGSLYLGFAYESEEEYGGWLHHDVQHHPSR